MITSEMIQYYLDRTNKHISLVRKYHGIISTFNLPQIVDELFDQEALDHDQSKFTPREFFPYVYITWKYYKPDYVVPEEIKNSLHEATFHHIKTNKHHPEYWDRNVKIDSLNQENRDKPSGVMVDAIKMPETYIAAMIADWFAMSEEKGTSIKQWVINNVNVRWKFDAYQVEFINLLVAMVLKEIEE
jgi:hypothetical protein